jgi:cell division protein FtsW
LFFLCLHIARHAADRFGQLLVLGMTFLIFFPAMFNIGVVCGVLPTKGMALPFFSYGGTHILASFVALGIIFSVGIHSLKDKKRAFLRKIVKN